MTHVVSAKALSKAPGTSIKVKDALGSKSHLPQTPDPAAILLVLLPKALWALLETPCFA